MKSTIIRLWSAVLGLAAVGAATAAQPNGDWTPLKIIQTESPMYPVTLINAAVKHGEARVALSINGEGQLEELLVIAYTHPDFARSAVTAIRTWKFEPARFRGEPVGVTTEITVNYELEGLTVVSMTPQDTVAMRFQMITDLENHFRPRALRELDRIPTPIAAPAPIYPAELAQQGRKGAVTIEFYIDEKGAVRLPSVSSGEDPLLAPLAIEALRRWKFEPPTCSGRPVLVKARQVFHFGLETKTAAPKKSGA
jgi:TonB family protein